MNDNKIKQEEKKIMYIRRRHYIKLIRGWNQVMCGQSGLYPTWADDNHDEVKYRGSSLICLPNTPW